MTTEHFAKFSVQLCSCSHSAAWHLLAWESWQEDKQTTRECVADNCTCVEFTLAGN